MGEERATPAPLSTVAALLRTSGHGPGDRPSLDFMRDYAGARLVSTEIARHIAPLNPGSLLIWDEVQSGILGFLVAERLGCKVLRAYENNGLLNLVDQPRTPHATVVLADTFISVRSVSGLVGLAQAHDLHVEMIASVLPGVLRAAEVQNMDIPTFFIDGA